MAGKKNTKLLTAVVANPSGEIFELEGYAPVGMAGSCLVPLSVENTIPMPFGSELMFLPERSPLLYDCQKSRIESVKENPLSRSESVFPVSLFNSPGYVVRYVSAFTENETAGFLPLFSYGAVGWHHGRFRSAAVLVDSEKRQDLRLMKKEKVVTGIQQMRKKMPHNRLRAHLETCALEYGCPAAKNFFIGRYEAPLPTSQYCNARCLGCLSLQTNKAIPTSQKRIAFTPTAEEIAEVALSHIGRVKKSIVSFGQGCEGDPLLAFDVIEPAIRMIRSATDQGTINMNTNASKPDILERLVKAGLDSMRVSMNSVRRDFYEKYFRPKDYQFSDVEKSIDLAIRSSRFVSINYLNSPGFTDTPEEITALISFLKKHPIHMIQWRNLNYDPIKYWKEMRFDEKHVKPVGVEIAIGRIRKLFPKVKCGYFNPPKEKFSDPINFLQNSVKNEHRPLSTATTDG